ncbi:MAG: F0F1 ATP synthase subunit A [Balneolaceae bacterium]
MRRILLTLLFLLTAATTDIAAGNAADESDESSAPIDVMGKVLDHDYIDALGMKFYLPRILLAGGDLYLYKSTESALESGEFIMQDSGLVRADATPVSLDLSITSHLVWFWFSLVLALLLTLMAASRYKRGIGASEAPRGTMQNLFEVFFVFIRDDIAKEYIPGEKYKKYVTYLFSVFCAIAFMNLFGLLPWGVSPTADLTVTATLAVITFVITQYSGSKDHWRHVFMFPGVHPLVRFILTPVEILGLFTKPFALAIRLFANMLSGKIMIICILGLIFIFTDSFGATFGLGSSVIWVSLTAVIYILKAFIALLQAYIFTLLSAVFIGMAAEEHHHEHQTEHDSAVSAVNTAGIQLNSP